MAVVNEPISLVKLRADRRWSAKQCGRLLAAEMGRAEPYSYARILQMEGGDCDSLEQMRGFARLYAIPLQSVIDYFDSFKKIM